MEVPRYWRNQKYMLNPNKNGYRPEPPQINEPSPSAKITCIEYNGDPLSYTRREVQPYSQIMKDGYGNDLVKTRNTRSEIELVDNKITSGVIYQDAQIGVSV